MFNTSSLRPSVYTVGPEWKWRNPKDTFKENRPRTPVIYLFYCRGNIEGTVGH